MSFDARVKVPRTHHGHAILAADSRRSLHQPLAALGNETCGCCRRWEACSDGAGDAGADGGTARAWAPKASFAYPLVPVRDEKLLTRQWSLHQWTGRRGRASPNCRGFGSSAWVLMWWLKQRAGVILGERNPLMSEFTCPSEAEAALEALERRIVNLDAGLEAEESPDPPDVVSEVPGSPEPPD